MNIGIDIEETKKFKLDKQSNFLKNIFTKDELKYCFSKTQPHIHLCGIYCAKEAIIKTLSEKIEPTDIEIKRNKNKKPIIYIKNKIQNNIIKISISHCKTYAVANAINLENGK